MQSLCVEKQRSDRQQVCPSCQGRGISKSFGALARQLKLLDISKMLGGALKSLPWRMSRAISGRKSLEVEEQAHLSSPSGGPTARGAAFAPALRTECLGAAAQRRSAAAAAAPARPRGPGAAAERPQRFQAQGRHGAAELPGPLSEPAPGESYRRP